MNDEKDINKSDLSVEEGIKRLDDKIREMKKKNIVPPVDDEEPNGVLSGGPKHLDLDDGDK